MGDDTIEGARAFSARAWNEVGGFDESIVAGPEDWDMDQRVRELGGTPNPDDGLHRPRRGTPDFGETVRTKYYYGKSAAA